METTTAASLNTKLADRVLWYDGDSTIAPESLLRVIMDGKSVEGLFVDELTPDIVQYNINVSKKDERIRIKSGLNPLTYEWNIPDEYKTMDVTEYVAAKLTDLHGTDNIVKRAERVADELSLYEKLDLMDVLRTLIYIINTLIENNVVWGVGRGSSVASYVLYLMGVHDIDSFKYGLNIEEFLRTE